MLHAVRSGLQLRRVLPPDGHGVRREPDATAAVFSITAGIYNALGAPAGHLSDRYGPRPVLLAGAFFIATGLVLTSQIDRLWMGI
jgi:MFS family permease